MIDQQPVVHILVIGHNDGCVVLGDNLWDEWYRFPSGEPAILSGCGDVRHVGIMKIDFGTAVFEQFDDLQTGAFANVLHIPLVGEAEEQDFLIPSRSSKIGGPAPR